MARDPGASCVGVVFRRVRVETLLSNLKSVYRGAIRQGFILWPIDLKKADASTHTYSSYPSYMAALNAALWPRFLSMYAMSSCQASRVRTHASRIWVYPGSVIPRLSATVITGLPVVYLRVSAGQSFDAAGFIVVRRTSRYLSFRRF
jgi:hypothetical protein